MPLETQVLYEFGSFRLNPADHSLLCDERRVPLTPKSFEILVMLVERNGSLVTKDELMKRIWPDSFVEEANLTVNVSALRKTLGDTPGHQQYIETVPNLGYRFIAPVSTVPTSTSIVPTQPSTTHEEPISVTPVDTKQPVLVETKRVVPWRRILLGLVALVVAAVLIFVFWQLRKTASSQKISTEPRRLAILPFRNLKPDPASDFLGYSLADAVITRLGSVQSLRVRPSYAVEKYRDQTVDIPKVATDLDVDTLLTANYIRDGDDLRITCQLVNVKTRNILWKGAFDLRYQKLLTVQDQVSEQIIHGLELNLSTSEAAQMKADEPADPLAYEYFLRGVDLYARSDFPLAISMLEKSSELDPRYAPTWAYLGRSYNASASFQLEGLNYYRKAQAAFDRALALQPAETETRIYLANFLTDTGRVEQSVPLLRESLKTNPHHAELHWELGYAYRFAGMLDESVAECEQARQLDPNVKLNSSALNTYLYLGQYDKFLQSIPASSDLPFHLFYRGFAEYHQKNFDRASADFDRSYGLNPALLQTQVGKALSEGLSHHEAKGLEILRAAENKVNARGVGDSEAIYKIAQAFAVLGDRQSALRMLKHSIDTGFFPYPYFMSDPLLNNIRSESQFAELMESARQRHDSFQKTFFWGP